MTGRSYVIVCHVGSYGGSRGWSSIIDLRDGGECSFIKGSLCVSLAIRIHGEQLFSKE